MCIRDRRQSVLTGLPGIGKTVAASLLALLPELGRLSRRQAAALAGVAPHPDQTGTTRNRGRTIGGRRVLRPVLFPAALHARPFFTSCPAHRRSSGDSCGRRSISNNQHAVARTQHPRHYNMR